MTFSKYLNMGGPRNGPPIFKYLYFKIYKHGL